MVLRPPTTQRNNTAHPLSCLSSATGSLASATRQSRSKRASLAIPLNERTMGRTLAKLRKTSHSTSRLAINPLAPTTATTGVLAMCQFPGAPHFQLPKPGHIQKGSVSVALLDQRDPLSSILTGNLQ